MWTRYRIFVSRHRSSLGVAGFVAVILVVMYPICIHPLMHVEEYKKKQSEYRGTFYSRRMSTAGCLTTTVILGFQALLWLTKK